MGSETGSTAANKKAPPRASTGKQAGQIEALWAILAARGIPVDAEYRARIEVLRDPEALRGLLARALTVTSAAELSATGMTG